MSDLRQAAQAALEALEDYHRYTGFQNRATDALRAALAAPEAEPMAWCAQTFAEDMASDGRAFVYASPGNVTTPARLFAPLYASPPARTPMTKSQIFDALMFSSDYKPVRLPQGWEAFAHAVERHHGIGGE